MMNEATIANSRPLWTRKWRDPETGRRQERCGSVATAVQAIHRCPPSEIRWEVEKHWQPISDDSNLFIETCNTTAHSAVTTDDDKIAVLVTRLSPTLREHVELKKTLGTYPSVLGQVRENTKNKKQSAYVKMSSDTSTGRDESVPIEVDALCTASGSAKNQRARAMPQGRTVGRIWA